MDGDLLSSRDGKVAGWKAGRFGRGIFILSGNGGGDGPTRLVVDDDGDDDEDDDEDDEDVVCGALTPGTDCGLNTGRGFIIG